MTMEKNIERTKIKTDIIHARRKTIEDVVQKIQDDRTALIIELGKNEQGNYDMTQNLKKLVDDMESWADTLDDLTYYHWVFATKKKGEE